MRLLQHAGVVDKTDDGRVVLPYDTIRFDFTIEPRRAA
jgi:hypothetical protein